MKNSKYFLFTILASSLFFTACDDDDNVQINDEELITTVELTFSDLDGNSSTFTIRDTDGDGGNPPEKETIQLDTNTAYTVNVRFLDESNASDVEDITEEVQEESDEHLVCFSTTGNLEDVIITDTDSAGNQLGLAASLTTGEAGNGTLAIILKHQPDKSLANPCSTGETDAEVIFNVMVE